MSAKGINEQNGIHIREVSASTQTALGKVKEAEEVMHELLAKIREHGPFDTGGIGAMVKTAHQTIRTAQDLVQEELTKQVWWTSGGCPMGSITLYFARLQDLLRLDKIAAITTLSEMSSRLSGAFAAADAAGYDVRQFCESNLQAAAAAVATADALLSKGGETSPEYAIEEAQKATNDAIESMGKSIKEVDSAVSKVRALRNRTESMKVNFWDLLPRSCAHTAVRRKSSNP